MSVVIERSDGVQSAVSYVCPSWCVSVHDEVLNKSNEVSPGLWYIWHESEQVTLFTSRATELAARLSYVEPVGHGQLPDHNLSRPYIEFGGYDGSGLSGFCELEVVDVPRFMAMLAELQADAEVQ